jgi:hypothetical protein
MGIQNGAAAVDNRMGAPQMIKIWPSNPTSGYVSKKSTSGS